MNIFDVVLLFLPAELEYWYWNTSTNEKRNQPILPLIANFECKIDDQRVKIFYYEEDKAMQIVAIICSLNVLIFIQWSKNRFVKTASSSSIHGEINHYFVSSKHGFLIILTVRGEAHVTADGTGCGPCL